MALFQKQHLTQTQSFYKVSASARKLVVGLGNIGKKYEGTRHNIGFACLDTFAAEHNFEPWINKKDFKGLFAKKTLGDTDVVLIKPTTYMNRSGTAVEAVRKFYQIEPASIIVVHDELDLAFGQIRIRPNGGSDAGNKGIRSIAEHIGSEFGRVKIGVSKDPLIPPENYVLQKFSKQEEPHLKALTKEAASILTEFVYSETLPSETRNFLV